MIKNQKFVFLWVSQVLSQLTINIMNFLLLAFLYTSTNSAIATSFLWLAYALPAVLIGPIGAATVDLFSRRKMLMITNLLQSGVIFLYYFIHSQSVFILYAVVLIYSLLNQFYLPAESATLPSVVSPKKLARANSIFFMTAQLTLILGFGFAGLLQKLFGFNGVLIMSGTFLFIAFLSVSFLPEIKSLKKVTGNIDKIVKTVFDTILEGYAFIKKQKAVLFPLLILLGIQAALAITVVSLPVIATEILGIAVAFSGVSIVVPAGIGAFLGSVYVPKLVKRRFRKKTVIELSLGLIVFSLFAITLLIPLISVPFRLATSTILLIIVGFAFVGINIPALTFLQESTPMGLRGRVFGNLWFMTTVITILPVLFSGAISEIFGVRALFAILALMFLIVLVYSVKQGQSLIEEKFN